MTDTNWINNPLQTKFQEVYFELYDVHNGFKTLSAKKCKELAEKMSNIEPQLFKTLEPEVKPTETKDMIKQYYYYDHTYGEGGVIGDFSKLMDFMKYNYDKDRHTVQDCLKSHKQCCKENDNPIEKDYTVKFDICIWLDKNYTIEATSQEEAEQKAKDLMGQTEYEFYDQINPEPVLDYSKLEDWVYGDVKFSLNTVHVVED